MTSRHLRLSSLVALLVAAPIATTPLLAQSSQTTGTVRGVVTSKGGAALSGATLILQNLETGSSRTIQTDAKGAFQAPLLPVGPYVMTLSAPGMKSQKNDKLIVTLGGTANLNLVMEPSAMATATIEVVASAQTLDPQQVNSVSTVDAKLVESIPLVTRNFQDLVRLTPGAVAGPGNPPRLMVGGARQIMNNLQIDGAGQNSNFFGEQRGGAIIPFVFGADTIKELQVITNGYDAVYGNAAGAVVNAITKSGTNELSGSALYQIRNDSWQAKARPVPYDPAGLNNTDSARTRVGNSFNANFNIGGPIIKDKLHYFIGVETYKKDLGAKPGFPTPAGTGNTAADVDAFAASKLYNVLTGKGGLTLGQEGGNPNLGSQGPAYTQQTKNTSYFGRLDFALNEKHHLTLRLNLNKFNDTIGGGNSVFSPASNLLINETNAISWVLEANSIWTNELFSETRVQVANERRPFTGNSGVAPAINIGGATFGTKTSTPREMNEITEQFINNTTWTRGDWTVKGGVDLQKIGIDNQFFNNGNGSISFASYAMAAAWANGTIATTTPASGTPITYSGATSINGGRVHIDTDLNAVYLQAQYQGLLEKRLILTTGLRYTSQKISNNPRPNANLAGLDSANSTSSTDPRFAFSFDLDGKGKTLIRGGYGWFSSPTPMLLVANTMTGNGNTITNYSYALSLANTPTGIANRAIFNSGALSAAQLISGNIFSKATDATITALATNSAFAAGSASGVQIWDPETKLARAKKASLGFEHDLGNGLTVGVTGIYTEFENLQYLRNINLNQVGNGLAYNDGYADPTNNNFTTVGRPGTATVRGHVLNFGPAATTPGNPAAGFGDVWLVNSNGYGRYKALTLSTSKRFNDDLGFIANVTFSKSQDTNSNERGTFTSTSATNPLSELGLASTPYPANPYLAFGTSDNDRKIVLNVAGYFPIYFGIKGSARFNYSSGLPYSAYSGKDLNGDKVPNDLQFGIRNGERQTPNKVLDLRLVRAFKIYKHFEIEGSIDVFNVFNWAQQDVAGTNSQDKKATLSDGITPNPSFGQIQGKDFNTREVQFGIRLRF